MRATKFFDLGLDLEKNGISSVCADDMSAFLKSLSENFVLSRKDLSYVMKGMYAFSQAYYTKSEGLYESHKRFIDVQCVLEGCEEIELCPVSELTVKEPYDESHDIAFYDGDIPCTDKVVLSAGECCVIMPSMGHKPCMDSGGRHFVKKVMFKIPVE